MKSVLKIMTITALVAGVAAPAFAESKAHSKSSMMISSSQVVTGTNPMVQTTDGPGSAKNTERSMDGYGTTTGPSTGPSGGSKDAPRVMPRETR